eukprot:74772_1
MLDVKLTGETIAPVHYDIDHSELLGKYKIMHGLFDKKNHIWSAYIGTTTTFSHSKPKPLSIMKVSNIFTTQSDAKMILKELRILTTLSHDNIIQLHDIIPPKHPLKFNSIITIREYCGPNLSQILLVNDNISPQHIQYIMYQILSAIQHIHSKKIAHRNLTTSAICITDFLTVKITDFLMAYYFGNNNKLIIPYYSAQKWTIDDEFDTQIKKIKQLNISDNAKKYQIQKIKIRRFKRIGRPISKRKFKKYWGEGILYQPPDIILLMLSNGNYSATMTATDIWSIGAIFGELLQKQSANDAYSSYITTKKPLFYNMDYNSNNMFFYETQYGLQYEMNDFVDDGLLLSRDDPMTVRTKLIGCPSKEIIDKFENENVRNYLYSLPEKRKTFDEIFPATDKIALELLKRLLWFESDKRINVNEALKHTYFNSMRNMKRECKQLDNNKLCLRFDLKDMEQKQMRVLLLHEILKYNKDEMGRFVLSGAMLNYKLDVVLDGYIRKYIRPLICKHVIIPISIVEICCMYIGGC